MRINTNRDFLGNCDICAEQKIFVHERDEMVRNLAQTERLSSKKSFKLYYCQISVRVITTVALNFIHFALHGQKWAECSKDLTNFQVRLVKFSKNILFFYRIKQKSMVLHEYLWNWMKVYKSQQNFMKVNDFES